MLTTPDMVAVNTQAPASACARVSEMLSRVILGMTCTQCGRERMPELAGVSAFFTADNP